jgi:molybdate transport system ATP-binding protein
MAKSNMQQPVLEVRGLTVRLGGKIVLDNISFTLQKGECLAVTGPTGSGKTTLIKALASQIFSSGVLQFPMNAERKPRIVVISRQHQFTNLSNISSFYYQQRFNSFDSEDARKLEDELTKAGTSENDTEKVLTAFGLTHVRHAPLLQLSNGEHKRFQLARAILQHPEWILLDNPYTGLDKEARIILNEILEGLVRDGIQIVLVTGPSEIPPVVTHTAVLDHGKIITFSQKENAPLPAPTTSGGVDLARIRNIPAAYPYPPFSTAIKMIDTTISYHGKNILDKINWEVKHGQCWNVAGHNGSGKSTLISLINGDNPQAFANQIWLFDKRKGSGESIWDIKQKTGFVSPELHHYFESSSTCFHVIASGLFDTMGLFRKLNASQQTLTEQWMECMQVAHLSERLYHNLSDGEQRKVLLTRSLVKNPPLLLLDEPCQGLDTLATTQFIAMINDICIQLKKTMIYVSHYEAEIPGCVSNRLELIKGKSTITAC